MKKLTTLLFSTLLFVATVSQAQSNINWSMGMNISTNTYGNMHPRVALDAVGNPLVVWGRMSDEAVFFSRWNGANFSAPVKLNPAGFKVATAAWMGPDIASHGDTVYVVVKRTPEASDTNHIYIIRSFNGGQNFSAPVRVDFIADSISRFPTVTTDATGNPIIAFMKFNASFVDSRWVVTKSTDYGKTFSVDVKASGWGGSAEVCDCCPAAIVSAGNIAAMLYRNNKNNIRDSWMGISTNNSTSFSNGCNIDNNNWMLMSCPSSGPDGVIIGNTLYSVFMNGASGNYRNYLSKSSVSAVAVNSVIGLTGSIPGLSQQNYPRIASSGNAVAIVWQQSVSGNEQLPILFTNNINNGFPAKYDTVDLADITNTDVALLNGKIFVVWQDDNSGTVKYRKGTYATTGIQENLIGPIVTLFPNPANNQISINFNQQKITAFTIYNTLGQAVQSFETDNTGIANLQLSDWEQGLYFIKSAQVNTKFLISR